MVTPDEVRKLAQQVAAELSPEQQRAFLAALMGGGLTEAFGDQLGGGFGGGMVGGIGGLLATPAPQVGDVPERTRGFRVRLDLHGSKPPVWRRLELPGDLTLDRLHLVVQAAMGWSDSHLHRFRTGNEPRAPYFVTSYDVEEGEDGVLEDGVRLDQVVAAKGDRLWYDYDFGDGWEHVLAVEAVLPEPPERARCTAGRLACPPEDCGGIWGYAELARWVRGGYDPAAVPDPFDDAEHAREWLPLDWHPDGFDLAEADTAVATLLAQAVPVAAELAALRDQLEWRGDRSLTEVLVRAMDASGELDEAEAVRLLAPFEVLLDVIGDGVRLTGAGYLPPAVVEQLAERTGITSWYIGKANREDLTWPVAQLRQSAQVLGLVSVRKGVLAPTAAVRRNRHRPLALWRHIVSRLPLGKNDFDRQAGWLSLAVAASGTPSEEWSAEIKTLLLGLGWRVKGGEDHGYVPVTNPTLDVLEVLAGRSRPGRPTGCDQAVAATARAAIAPGAST